MRTFAALLFSGLAATAALAVDPSQVTCPPPPAGVAPGCRILVINPAEELSLVGTGNVLDAAEWSRRMELTNTIIYWRQKLQNAPFGQVAPPPPVAKPAPSAPAPNDSSIK